jgi:hypothetical protein
MWLDHLGSMDKSRLLTLPFHHQPRGQLNAARPRNKWKAQEHLEQ